MSGPPIARLRSFAYFLALAAKPIAVGLPFLFLLLDVWPLGRTRLAPPAAAPPRAPGGTRQLFVEKLPLFALAALSCAVTFIAQSSAGAVRDLGSYPLGVRIATALVAYPTYVASAVWPADLSVYYPHPHGFAAWKIAGGAAFLIAASAGALAIARRVPAVAVGWCWFLGWLFPVIGLVQIGGAWRADRYTYFAFIGLFVAAAWGAAALVAHTPRVRRLVEASAVLVLLQWTFAMHGQLAHWRDTRALFEHALAVDPSNAMAHASLGRVAEREGRDADALAHYDQAFSLAPDFGNLREDRARVLRALGSLHHEVRAEHERRPAE